MLVNGFGQVSDIVLRLMLLIFKKFSFKTTKIGAKIINLCVLKERPKVANSHSHFISETIEKPARLAIRFLYGFAFDSQIQPKYLPIVRHQLSP